MKYRRLGKTNLKVSVIGMGTWQLGGEWNKNFDQAEVNQMFDAARDLGINLIDTAECYGDHTSEALIGGAIERDRDQWIIATKFGHKYHGPFNRTEPRTPADVQRQLEDSLRALRTDYVDLLQYHSWSDKDFARDDVRLACEKLVQSGKVRHLGNSISPNDNMGQVEQSERYHIQTIQLIYNRIDRKPEERLFGYCQAHDLGVLARVPLASGLLSGKYKPGATFAEVDPRHIRERAVIDKTLEQVRLIAPEVPDGVPMARWALAWCLQHPAVSCAIPGCKSVEQVQENGLAADLPLVPDDHPQAWHGGM